MAVGKWTVCHLIVAQSISIQIECYSWTTNTSTLVLITLATVTIIWAQTWGILSSAAKIHQSQSLGRHFIKFSVGVCRSLLFRKSSTFPVKILCKRLHQILTLNTSLHFCCSLYDRDLSSLTVTSKMERVVMCPATMLREALHVSIFCTVDTGGMSYDLHSAPKYMWVRWSHCIGDVITTSSQVVLTTGTFA
jgi:hypothetical protein